MPLERLSSLQALQSIKENQAKWPDSLEDPRLLPFTGPSFSPSFFIEPEDKVFCMGSCFARNIEAALLRLHIDCVTARVDNPYISGAWGRNNFLIRYNPFSMLNELSWSLDPEDAFPQEGFLNIGLNKWLDPHSHSHLFPLSRNKVVHLRQIVRENTQRLKECRIFILTLGLVEAWYDHQIQKYMNVCPPIRLIQQQPERFSLDVLDYESIVQALESIYSLLKRYGHEDFKILLSVSPVPLNKTFRSQDIFTANMYSKSVLRSALEGFVLTKPNVDYFPSYESILYSERQEVWEKDQRHVTEEVVRFNITRMIQKYLSSKSPHFESLSQPFVKREAKPEKKWFHFFK